LLGAIVADLSEYRQTEVNECPEAIGHTRRIAIRGDDGECPRHRAVRRSLAQVHANWLSAVAGIVISSCRWIFASFTERENIEILFSNASLRLCSSKCQYRRIDGFVGQLEGAEMHPEAATGLQV
jgi:hypothetical protein